MSARLIIKDGEQYGNWLVLEANIINPNTTAKLYIGKNVFSKCLCLNCNETIKLIRNNELKKYSTCVCKKCSADKRLVDKRPKINQRFGKLTVIKDGGVDENKLRHCSICQCDCGNIIKVKDNALKTGNTTSCGKCKYSKGEYQIKMLLDQYNICYDYDSIFLELLKQTKRRLRFDFIIYNDDGSINRFVEFDGNQHQTGMWGGSWNNIETYDVIHERDCIKDDFCKNNNYILVRIPYSKLNNLSIEDIMGTEYIKKKNC